MVRASKNYKYMTFTYMLQSLQDSDTKGPKRIVLQPNCGNMLMKIYF